MNVNTIEDGENAVFADLDNEMDGIITNSSGATESEQSVSTNVWIASGSTKQAIKSSGGIVVKIGDVTIGSSYTSSTGAATDWCKCTITGLGTINGSVTVYIKSGTTVSSPINVTIQVKCTIDGSDVTQNVTLTISPVRAGADGQMPTVYNLLPSPSEVSAGRNASGYITPQYHSVICGYTTSGASVTTVTDATGTIANKYRIFFKRRNRSTGNWDSNYKFYGYSTYYNQLVITETANSGLDARTYDKVEFILYENTSSTTLSSVDATKIRDKETVSVIADGATGPQGGDGKDAAIASVSPASINVQCYSNGNVAKAVSSTSLTFSLKVGNTSVAANKISVSNPSTIPTGVTITGVSYNVKLIAISTSATADGLKNGITFTVSATIDSITYSAPVTLQLPCSYQGSMSRNIYFAGKAKDIAGQSFEVTDYKAPYVQLDEDDPEQPTCKVFVGANGTHTFPTKTSQQTWAQAYDNFDWQTMGTIFKYLITQATFAEFAKLGSAIFNKDFMFSQWGYALGFDKGKVVIENSTQYQYADPADMFGDKTKEEDMEDFYASPYNIKNLPNTNISVTGTSYSKVQNGSERKFQLEGGRYYTVEVDASSQGTATNLIVMVALNSDGGVPSESEAIAKFTIALPASSDQMRSGYATFYCSQSGDYAFWAKRDNFYATIKARFVAKTKFIPQMCIDLLEGKMVANDIIARGKLYANSLYYQHVTKATTNGAIIVGDESFVTLRGGGSEYEGGGCGTTITLPATSNSKGRTIEIFTGFTERDRGYFYLTYSGAENNQSAYFLCPTTSNSNQHYREAWLVAHGHYWSESYVKLWCDGTNWWVMKAEITQYVDGDFVIRPSMTM